MSYATVADLVARFGERELIQLTDRATPQTDAIDPTVAQVALDAATEIADGYVAVKYSLPLATVPALLVDIVADIARFRLFSDQAPEAVIERNKAALVSLARISAGTMKIDVGGGEPAPRADVVITSGPCREFTRDSLRRF